MTWSSSSQLLLAFPTYFFNSSSMILLAVSVCPLLCGSSIEIALCLIPRHLRNFLTPLSMNCVPLLEIKVLGIPNWHTIFFQMNFRTLAAKMVVIGSASIHLVKWSMPTRIYFTCSFDSGKYLSMSTSQMANGHGVTMLCNSSAGKWEMLPNF